MHVKIHYKGAAKFSISGPIPVGPGPLEVEYKGAGSSDLSGSLPLTGVGLPVIFITSGEGSTIDERGFISPYAGKLVKVTSASGQNSTLGSAEYAACINGTTVTGGETNVPASYVARTKIEITPTADNDVAVGDFVSVKQDGGNDAGFFLGLAFEIQ